MKQLKTLLLSFFGVFAFASFAFVVASQEQQKPKKPEYKPYTLTKDMQKALTPAQALELLKDGNERFREGRLVNRDLRAQIKSTAEGQYPYSVILSCQDSRTSNDLLFDLNKGDAFSLRVAGNVVNGDMLGGMEFGTKAAGAKLIAVVGHSKCGAVYGAIDNVQMGNLTGLLNKIKPAIADVPASIQPRDSKNPRFVEAVAEANVRYQMREIREKSPILKEAIDKGEVGLVGGMYDISTGEVKFFDK